MRARAPQLRPKRDCLFIGTFPTGISYANRCREEHGDYARLAFLDFDTLILSFRPGCPAKLREEIKKHASKIQARRGEQLEISASGHTVLLGRKTPSRDPKSKTGPSKNKILADIRSWTATAVTYRLRGNISTAKSYEDTVDRLSTLAEARGWGDEVMEAQEEGRRLGERAHRGGKKPPSRDPRSSGDRRSAVGGRRSARDRALLLAGPYASLDAAVRAASRHRGVRVVQVQRGRWAVVRGPSRDVGMQEGSLSRLGAASYVVEYREGHKIARYPAHGGLSLVGARAAAREFASSGVNCRVVQRDARGRRSHDPWKGMTHTVREQIHKGRTDIRFYKVAQGMFLLYPDTTWGKKWMQANLPDARWVKHTKLGLAGRSVAVEGSRNGQQIYLAMVEAGLKVELRA